MQVDLGVCQCGGLGSLGMNCSGGTTTNNGNDNQQCGKQICREWRSAMYAAMIQYVRDIRMYKNRAKQSADAVMCQSDCTWLKVHISLVAKNQLYLLETSISHVFKSVCDAAVLGRDCCKNGQNPDRGV